MLTMNNTIDCFCIIFHITKYYGIFNVLFYFNFLVNYYIITHDLNMIFAFIIISIF